METKTVFVKRYISSGERPKKSGIYMTDAGFNQYRNERFDLDPKWWLQEIELPKNDEIFTNSLSMRFGVSNVDCYLLGANFILNKLKGE